MEQLTVIATEGDTLVLAAESGGRFALPLDDVLRAELRRGKRDPEPRTHRATPRDIQAHIRAGLSVDDVASLLAVRREDVEKYERPVMAEREHIVGRALVVPVVATGELEPGMPPTFGSAVRAKLAGAGATAERWTSWKEPDGWIIKLEFTIADVEHDARWTFDPRRSALVPQNPDAVQLSRQGSLPDALIPRLRALEPAARGVKDESRFDSGAFGIRGLPEPEGEFDTGSIPIPAPPAVRRAAIHRAPEPPQQTHDTADLLEALRRRRGQREPLPGATIAAPVSAASVPVALFDPLEPAFGGSDEHDEGAGDHDDDDTASPRRGRASMPSWDEIVFGARTED